MQNLLCPIFEKFIKSFQKLALLTCLGVQAHILWSYVKRNSRVAQLSAAQLAKRLKNFRKFSKKK